MSKRSKRMKGIDQAIDREEVVSVDQAIEKLKQCPPVKFDQSIEIAMKMGVDPRKSDQLVRGTVSLPHGTGKKLRVLALTQGEKIQEALDAGAEFAGPEYIDKIKDGWVDFDAVVASPDMMREVGKLGRVLGPRGLMPTPKDGTVTADVGKAVVELKKGKISFKVDRHGVINNAVGKVSFEVGQLTENLKTFISSVMKAKPAGAKGQYVRSVSVSSTMGPGLRIDPRSVEIE
ncbi:MAG: 50S ribosomal protein L1 [Chlamydiia bacterium]|nr:50S ribosomal protein L1 [Chlamydiia bacterium]